MTKMITPSAWLLGKMVDDAMRRCDVDIEQARLREEAESDAAYARAMANEAKARYYARLQRGVV